MKALIPLLLLSLTSALHAEMPSVYLHFPFQEKTAAMTGNETPLPASRETKTAFGPQGLRLGPGSQVEYDLTEGFPAQAGAIELWFNPEFPQAPDQAERVIFAFTGPGGQRLEFGYKPQGTRWRFGLSYPGWKAEIAAYYFQREEPDQWHQFVLSWDEKEQTIQFFRDGRWDKSRTQEMRQPLAGFTKLVIGGEGDLQTSLDEITIYQRPLTATDVDLLHASAGKADRFMALAEKAKADALAAKQAQEKRRQRLAQLKGRAGYLINPRGGEQRDIKLPGGIVATGIRVEDVGKVDLSKFAVIYGPPGGAYQLDESQTELIRAYVQNGGGYVGVCAGANYCGRAKLLNMSTHSLKNQGLVSVGVQKHPITEGFIGEVVIHHGNGPIMVPGEGCQVVGTFQIGQNFPITTAAIVAGENGKGRVAAFGPHPTGGGVEFESKGAKFSGAELGTDDLVVNALLWAAKVTP